MLAVLLWRALALLFVGAGLVGVVVPGMPTTVFMLLAVWAAGHGWPALQRWITDHPRYGPPVRQWKEHGAVPRRAKWLAAVTMTISAGLICLSGSPVWLKWALPLFLYTVLAWLWTRPDTAST